MNPETPERDPVQVPHTPKPPAPSRPLQRDPISGGSFTPVVTYTLLAITVAVFLAQMGSEVLVGFDLPSAIGMKDNRSIAAVELWRLITPMFLHGSLLHIGFNMYALYIFGPGLERHFGRMRFISLYFLSGFAGNVGSLLFTDARALGSSTAIFGLLGAQGVFIYQNRELFGQRARGALNQILTIAAINLVIGLAPQIDNWGHIGGLIGGSLFSWFGGPIFETQGIFPAVRITDVRETGEVFRAGLWVILVFASLALVKIVLGV